MKPPVKAAKKISLILPTATAVDIIPELYELAGHVERCMYWPGLRAKYRNHLPFHILNYMQIVEFGIGTKMQETTEADNDAFLFNLHQQIYQEHSRELANSLTSASRYFNHPKALTRFQDQADTIQTAYNSQVEKLDKWDCWRASHQSWVQAFSIMACAHACMLTNCFHINSAPTSAERLFPLAIADLRHIDFPLELLY